MARWMDPTTGTFLSVDPVVGSHLDPQAYNAYSYARNNPISLKDPKGLCPAALFGGGPCYQVDSYSRGTTLFTVYTNSAAAAGAVWLSPFEAGPLPSSSGPTGGGGGFGFVSMGPSLAGFGGLGGGVGGTPPAPNGNGSSPPPQQPSDTSFIDQTLNSSTAVAAYGEQSRVRNGQWRGQNGKWNSLDWGGNQHTGARSQVLKRSAQFRAAGRAFGGAQAALGVGEMVTGDTPMERAEGGFSTGLALLGFAGPEGLVISLGAGFLGIDFGDVVYGYAVVADAIIEAGPNGPMR